MTGGMKKSSFGERSAAPGVRTFMRRPYRSAISIALACILSLGMPGLVLADGPATASDGVTVAHDKGDHAHGEAERDCDGDHSRHAVCCAPCPGVGHCAAASAIPSSHAGHFLPRVVSTFLEPANGLPAAPLNSLKRPPRNA